MDCHWSKWGLWSKCSKSCGNGFSLRKRTKVTTAENGGKECVGKNTIRRSCNKRRCPTPGIKRIFFKT